MTSEEAAAIRSRKGKEDIQNVARRYGASVNTVQGLWMGFAAPGSNGDEARRGPVSTVGVPETAKERIRQRMDDMGHSYTTLGEEIGIDRSTVCHIVTGYTTGACQRYALARALDRWPEDFWWEDE